jgi:hypothetical protein
MNNPDHIF